MHRFLIALLSIILLSPTIALADISDQCDEATAACFCDNASGISDVTDVGSTNDCFSFCQNLDNSIDFDYTIQCISGGEYVTIDQGSFQDVLAGDRQESGDQTITEPDPDPIVPELNIDIPGLEFSTPVLSQGNVQVNFIGEYIAALYQWIIYAAAIVAVVLMMIGGLQWMIAGGNAAGISKAKKRISDAITGLVLILAAYTIAFYIDPSTTQFNSLNLKVIQKEEFPGPDGDAWDYEPRDIPKNSTTIYGDHIVDYTNGFLQEEAAEALAEAGDIFYENFKKNIEIKSSTRTLSHQAELFYNNCLSKPGLACGITTCNPASGSSVISGNSGGYTVSGDLADALATGSKSQVINVLVENSKEENCPHTSTVAVDAWCPGSHDYEYDPECQFNLMRAMSEAGWCRLTLEPWHFEFDKYKLSTSSCSLTPTPTYIRGGQTYNPGTGESCKRWAYKENKCIQK